MGPETSDFAVGDEVFGFVPPAPSPRKGSFAERISDADIVLVPKPVGLGFHDTAALPLAGTVRQHHPAGITALVDLVNQGDALTDVGEELARFQQGKRGKIVLNGRA